MSEQVKPARRKKAKPATSEQLMEQKGAALLAAMDRRWKAKRDLRAAERAEREAERQFARFVLGAVQHGGRENAGWLVNWWNNAATSPREARGLPCVLTAAEIPADAEPLPEPEGA